MIDGIKIKVSIRLPWANEEKQYYYEVDRIEVRDSLAPLPRNQEIDYLAHFEAMKQHERRKRLTELIAKQISNALMNACESEDADHGYKK